ncbi:hypothetical protein ABTX62_02755 [Streptomyces sp. NPDC096046]|uniref:hypothetical protein n=1 Tax=Streptomyces sp. NPDC096046 TaxID=3155542 RepID=UPI0033202561
MTGRPCPRTGCACGARQIGAGFDSRPDNIRKAAENSLRCLQTDCTVLCRQQAADPDAPVEEAAGV